MFTHVCTCDVGDNLVDVALESNAVHVASVEGQQGAPCDHILEQGGIRNLYLGRGWRCYIRPVIGGCIKVPTTDVQRVASVHNHML